MVDKEKFVKIQQGYSKNQTCLEKIEFRVTKIKVVQKKLNINKTRLPKIQQKYNKIKVAKN